MTQYDKMTKTPLVKLIVTLGIPTTISMLVTNIYNMADTYFVGTLGESQQAATGILFTLQAIMQAVAFMLGQGSGTMVSKAQADRNDEEASTYVSTAFYSSLAFGLCLTVFGLLFLEPFMYFLGSTDTILPYAMQYGVCVLVSCPMFIASMVLNNNLRYEGMSFYSMIGLVSGAIVNILGDYLLIIVFKWGVLGAGISTALSQIMSFCLLFYYYKKKAQSTISLRYMAKDTAIYGTICKVGFPAFIRQGLTSIAGGVLNNLTRPYGDAAIAAMSVVNRFSALIMCVGLGIGQGYQPVAAFNYQAKRLDRVKKGLLVTMAIGGVMISTFSILGICFAEEIVRLFQNSDEVVEVGTFALQCACGGTIFLALSVPVNMLYQSTRQVKASTLLSLMRSGLMFIPTLLITTNLWGLTGIQISQPIADVLSGLFSIPFIVSFMRRKE